MSGFPTDLQHVAIYLRKSRADLEAEARGEGETLSRHRRALLEMAKKYKYNIREMYEEVVNAEFISQRPVVQRLLQDVQDGKYEAVLTMDIDRLGRGNQIDQGIIATTFKYSETLIITPRKVYDLQDELDEEWSEFEQFIARREYKIIARRLAQGRRMAAKEGKNVGRIPYGYQRGDDLHLIPDPETAPIVRQIFELRAQGMGRYGIAHWLDDRHIAPPAGSGIRKAWESVTVRDIINNETYLGRIIFGQVKYVKTPTGDKRKVNLPRERWIIVENAHPPIIDQELWDRAHAMQDAMSAHNAKDYKLKNALAGLIRCGNCGKIMVRRNHQNRSKNMLLCNTHRCNTRIGRYEDVEALVLEQLAALSRALPQQDQKNDRKSTQQDEAALLQRRIKGITEEIANLEKQRESLHDFLERGIYSIEVFMERSKNIGDRLDTANKELAEAQAELDGQEQARIQRDKLLPAIANVVKQYNKTKDIEAKNKLLKSVLREVRYYRPKEWPLEKSFELELFLRI
ncbi:recombinase family protein [Alicyclobacillus acidiphilus]|uniref:recombinase family protein n=1 Tax=Alicyclobacillus acidiphilus TaxID=182455 RepID=UPI00082C769C|nr:recombinase family protein [Alicyclobacillus acidiphilus]